MILYIVPVCGAWSIVGCAETRGSFKPSCPSLVVLVWMRVRFKRALQAMKIDNPDGIITGRCNAQPPIDMMLPQVEKMRAEIDQIKSQILLNVAKAEAAEVGPQFAQYQAYAQQLSGIAQQQSQ